MIVDSHDSFFRRAMSTAIVAFGSLNAMAYYSALTMLASGRQCVNGTFETIEDMRLTIDPHFETFIIHIPTYFTPHVIPLLIHNLPLSLIRL